MFSTSFKSAKAKQKGPTKQPFKVPVTTSNVDDYAQRIKNLDLSVLEQRALDFLHAHPGACHVDEIAIALEQPASALASIFLQLELKAVVESLPGACLDVNAKCVFVPTTSPSPNRVRRWMWSVFCVTEMAVMYASTQAG